jgi:hypothetical protein
MAGVLEPVKTHFERDDVGGFLDTTQVLYQQGYAAQQVIDLRSIVFQKPSPENGDSFYAELHLTDGSTLEATHMMLDTEHNMLAFSLPENF